MSLWSTRETIPTKLPDVYSGHYRFLDFRGRGNLLRIPLEEICALTADGLNLAGIRRILELQEETRQLRAELAALRERAAGTANWGRARPAHSTAEPSPPGN